MSAELEGRIRESLAAYADLVEEQEGTDVVLPERRTGDVVRRWRAPLLVAAAVVAAVTFAVWTIPTGGGDSATTAVADSAGGGRDGSGEERADAAVEQAPGEAAPLSEDAGVAATAGTFAVGVPVPFELYTHCGVLGADLDGVWFAAVPTEVESGNPPAGWDNPYQAGLLTLLTADTAVFRDDAGHEVRLQADEASRPPPCD